MRLDIWQIQHLHLLFAVLLMTYSAFGTKVAALRSGEAARATPASEHNAGWAARKGHRGQSFTGNRVVSLTGKNPYSTSNLDGTAYYSAHTSNCASPATAVTQVVHGRRALQWKLLGDAAVAQSAADPLSNPEADAASADLVKAFFSGSNAEGRSLADPQASAGNAAPDLAPIDASAGVSSAAAPHAVPMAALQRSAPVLGDAGSTRADMPSSEASYGGASMGGSAELAAAAAAPAPSLAVGDVAGDGAAAESACASLQGSPSDWLINGGALGYACAMQKMTHTSDEELAYTFHAPADTTFSAARYAQPKDLDTLLRQQLAAQLQQDRNKTVRAALVPSSFLAVPADQAYRNPQQALTIIAATASAAVQKARDRAAASGGGVMEFVPDPSKVGELIGCDLTAFFAATVSDPTINGVRLRPGNYSVNAGRNPDAHLFFPCNPRDRRKTPFTVDLSGSTLVFQDINKAGFSIVECANVVFVGPVTAYHALSALPFTQGSITAVTNDSAHGYTWTVQIHDGFPTDLLLDNKEVRASYLIRYDSKGKLIDNYYDAVPSAITKISAWPPKYRFEFDIAMPDVTLGDLVALRGGYAHGIMLTRCMNVTMANITMHNVGMFFVIDWSGHGNRFVENTLVPYPGQIGNGEHLALLASNGDGIHSVGATFGPIIERNTLANMGDDAISIHRMFSLVVKASPDNATIVLATGSTNTLEVGSAVGLYEGDQLLLLGSVNITAVREVPNPLPPTTRSRVVHKMNFTSSKYYEITVDDWPKAFQAVRFDSLITNMDIKGSGFVVRDNTVMNNRGRGLLVKTSNGLIERNNILGPAWWGIQIMPEPSWMEADWSQNVHITDNHIEANYGGILAGLIRQNDLGSGQYLNHKDIRITGNTVVRANYAPILVTSVEDVVIGNNTVRDCMCQPPPPGQGFSWIKPGALIFVENAQNVTISSSNTFINEAGCAYGDYARPIALGRNAVDVALEY